MTWDQRPGGDLDLSVLMGFEMASSEGKEVALRLEHATTKDQLFGEAAPQAVQLVMTADAADLLAIELIQAANRARGAASTSRPTQLQPSHDARPVE